MTEHCECFMPQNNRLCWSSLDGRCKGSNCSRLSESQLELHWVLLQDLLAEARAATKAAEARLAEEAQSRRGFLLNFQAKSKAALAERVDLEQQVAARRD